MDLVAIQMGLTVVAVDRARLPRGMGSVVPFP